MSDYSEVTAWLIKKSREFYAHGEPKRAETAAILASKVSRGAIRPDNLRTLPDPGFFEAGRIYRSSRHADLRFDCLTIDVDPATRETCAIGWRFGAPDEDARKREIAALDVGDWACCGWTDATDDDFNPQEDQ
ncbi:hypothetical protein [Streptomyces sp. SGAir0957]